MGWLEQLVGGGTSALTGSDQTAAAIQAQTAAEQQANQTQLDMFNTQQQNLQPWMQAGTKALGEIQDQLPDLSRSFTMNDFQADPGYAFRMSEGQKAIEHSAAARGGLDSGATMKALDQYSQGLGSQEYQSAYNRFTNDQSTRFNRLASLAGVGQSAVSQSGQADQNYANQVSNNQTGLGNSIAAANIAQANRTSSLIGQGAGMGMMGLMASDRRLKTNIEPVSQEDLQELRASLKPYRFNYKSEFYGKGDWIGVMAQDLEKTKLGRSLIVEDENGFKLIDMAKLMSLFLATLAEGSQNAA